MNTLKIAALICLTFAIGACETADDITLEQSRTCINAAMKISISAPAAASTKATECETSVRSLTSAESGRIGFSAILIMEGKISQLASSAQALSSGSNTIGTSMTYLAFQNNATGDANIISMNTYAARSGSAGILKIAAMIQTSNVLNKIASLTAGSEASVQTALGTLIGSGTAADKDAVAAALVTLQQTSCAGADSTSTACAKATQAIGVSGTTAGILTSFQTFLATSN